MPTIDLSNLPKQTNKIFLPLYKNESRYMLLYGGAGSGKSVFAVQKQLKRILVEKNHKVLVLRKVARTSRHSTFALFKKVIYNWGIQNHTKIKEGDISISIPSFNTEIIFSGVDDVEKIKSIADITMILMEELTEFKELEFNQIDMRLRGYTKYYKQITGLFNPDESKGAWIKRRFFDKIDKNATTLHSVAEDNQFIDAEYIDILEGIEDDTYYKIYKLGVWAVSKGIIYKPFQRIKEKDIPIYNIVKIYGLDFGYTHPMALTEIVEHKRNIYITEKLYESHLTVTDMIDKLKILIPDKRCVIYCDHDPDKIEAIRRAGFKAVPAYKVAGSVEGGIDFIKSIHSRIFVNDLSSNFFKEADIYKYKEKKDGTQEEGPVKFKDDLMDSFRMPIYTYFRKIWGTAKRRVKVGNKINRLDV